VKRATARDGELPRASDGCEEEPPTGASCLDAVVQSIGDGRLSVFASWPRRVVAWVMVGRRASFVLFAALVGVACGNDNAAGGFSGGGDAGADADGAPSRSAGHDCVPVCGGGKFCRYPPGPGFCAPPDAGTCTSGCPGCAQLPPPACSALPSVCGGARTCDCLLSVCPGGCGATRGTCSVNADGDWVIACLSC
jgi:hypothetical protein